MAVEDQSEISFSILRGGEVLPWQPIFCWFYPQNLCAGRRRLAAQPGGITLHPDDIGSSDLVFSFSSLIPEITVLNLSNLIVHMTSVNISFPTVSYVEFLAARRCIG